MNNLAIPELQIGMLVVTPSDNIPNITQDRRYVVEYISGEYIQVRNNIDEVKEYKAHLFIEADVYYTVLLWLTVIRLFDIDPKHL